MSHPLDKQHWDFADEWSGLGRSVHPTPRLPRRPWFLLVLLALLLIGACQTLACSLSVGSKAPLKPPPAANR